MVGVIGTGLYLRHSGGKALACIAGRAAFDGLDEVELVEKQNGGQNESARPEHLL
jgi:hypothetical protein